LPWHDTRTWINCILRVDLEGLRDTLASAAYANSGQICVSRTRLLVQHSVREAVVEKVLEASPHVFTTGSPLDEKVNFGPISNAGQYRRVNGYIQLARHEGTTASTAPVGGEVPASGYFVPPMLIDNARPDMRVVQEEIFGPVLSVLTFESEQEAVALANQTGYGLAATAWTRDMGRAHRLSRDIEAGRVDIRSSPASGASLAHLTAEPFKGSGHGAMGGVKGLEPYLRCKGVQFLTG